MQHTAQQRRFIFAVAVMITINVACWMWLVPADPNLNCNVTYFGLQISGEDPNFGIKIGFTRCQMLHFLNNIRGRITPPCSEPRVPMAEGSPRGHVPGFARGKVGNCQPSQEYEAFGHHWLGIDSW